MDPRTEQPTNEELDADIDLELLEYLQTLTPAERIARLDAEAAALGQAVENGLTPAGLQARVLESMPALLEKLPKPNEVRSVTIGSGDPLPSAIAQVVAVMDSLRKT